MIWVAMAVAGGFGAVVRHVVAPRVSLGSFSGVTVVNLVGTAALTGLVVTAAPVDALFVVGVGFLGGLTTFSTWMAEAIEAAVSAGSNRALTRVVVVAAAAVVVASGVLAA